MKYFLQYFLFAFVSSSLFISSELYADFEFSQTDFQLLYNQYRVGEPEQLPWTGEYFPFSNDGTAALVGARSPMQAYDAIAGTGNQAQEWERLHHSCSYYSGSEKSSCEAWYGHCNAWAAAAMKEPEPISSVANYNEVLSVAEQKGILTEVWMNSYSIINGSTDKSKPVGDWVMDSSDRSFSSFWDVSPRSFFLLLTNYIGEQRSSLIIDRYTGDEVWNAPLVAYRFLPIKSNDNGYVREGDYIYYTVKMTAKIYWTHSSTDPGRITSKFDIYSMTDDSPRMEEGFSESRQGDFGGRLLRFKLYFDGPVQVSDDGLNVLSSGRLIEDGIWDHMEKLGRSRNIDSLNYSHPDFIWLPTNPIYKPTSTYGNPYVNYEVVYNFLRGYRDYNSPLSFASMPSQDSMMLEFDNVNTGRGYYPATGTSWRDEIQKIFLREGYAFDIISESKNADKTVLKIIFPQGIDKEDVIDLLQTIGIGVNIY